MSRPKECFWTIPKSQKDLPIKASRPEFKKESKSFAQADSGLLPLLRFAAQNLGDPTFQEKQDVKTTEAIVKILSTLTDHLKNAWKEMNPDDKLKDMDELRRQAYLLKL